VLDNGPQGKVRGNISRRNTTHSLPMGWRNFFPVVLLCQFLVLAENRFWFYILAYLEYIQLWCCVSFLVLVGNSFWCYVCT
jgi:hypothetical protein